MYQIYAIWNAGLAQQYLNHIFFQDSGAYQTATQKEVIIQLLQIRKIQQFKRVQLVQAAQQAVLMLAHLIKLLWRVFVELINAISITTPGVAKMWSIIVLGVVPFFP